MVILAKSRISDGNRRSPASKLLEVVLGISTRNFKSNFGFIVSFEFAPLEMRTLYESSAIGGI